jgi:hypothetical protein
VLKISPPAGFDPRTVQLVASRYTDYAIAALKVVTYFSKNANIDYSLANPSLGSQFDSCGQTDGLTDMHEKANCFANQPYNEYITLTEAYCALPKTTQHSSTSERVSAGSHVTGHGA